MSDQEHVHRGVRHPNPREAYARNLNVWHEAADEHDRTWPQPHPCAYAIGLTAAEMDRLDLGDGETIGHGLILKQVEDDEVSGLGLFLVICGATHDNPATIEQTEAIGLRRQEPARIETKEPALA